MASAPGLDQRTCLAATHLADDDPVGTPAHGDGQRPAGVEMLRRLQDQAVRRGALDLRRVLDNQQPVPGM
jgi:hypothetical protein